MAFHHPEARTPPIAPPAAGPGAPPRGASGPLLGMLGDLATAGQRALACHARLGGLTERVCSTGKPYRVAVLNDCTAQVTGYLWDPYGVTQAQFPVPAPVEVILRARDYGSRRVADILHIRCLESLEIDNGARLLPHALCPEGARWALAELVAFNERLRHPQLREFVSRVLLDPRIGTPLLTCKGSQKHHHAGRGGLLVHLMSGMEPVASMARASGLSDEEVELAEVGYLLHDLGKLCTVGSGDARPELSRFVRHESLTPVLLAPHLQWLESTSPKAALALRYIFDFISQHPAQRGHAKFVGAEIVAMADQLNVAGTRNRDLSGMLSSRTDRIAANG